MDNTRSTATGPSYDPLSPLQTIRPDLLGFVFHLSWLYLLFYSSAVDSGRPFGGADTTDIIYLSSAVALALTLFVGAIRTKAFMRVAESKPCALLAPAVTALGTLLYCMQLIVPSLALVICGGILTGAGSSVLAARWASVFGNVGSRVVIANFPTILVVIVAICVSIGYLPHELCLALLVLLPLCSGGALQFARRYQRSREAHVERRHDADGTRRRAHYAPLIALVGLIGFTVALLPSFEVSGANYGLLFYLIAAVLVLGFVGTTIFLADRRSFPVLFLAPLAMLALILLPFAQYSTETLGDAFYPVGNIAFELLLLFGTVLFAQATDRSPAKTFMIGRITLALFDMAGSFLGQHLVHLGDATILVQLSGVCLFAASELLLLALVVSYLGHSRRSLGGASAKAGAATTPAAPVIAAKAVDAAVPRRDEVLARIADRFALSERERDVFVLLAEGRSAARIQEDLCIAAGTVNYHTRNIFQKLGVHSRQEIIDLVHDEAATARNAD